jgi:Tfp pilus assembly protein FimV
MRSIEHAFDTERSAVRRGEPAMTTAAAPRSLARASVSRASVSRASVSRPAAPARLTHRGRVVVVLLVLALLVVGGFVLGRVSSQAAGPSRPLPTVTVHAGETLWQIAARVAPHADRRALVLQIEQLNHLLDGRVVAGQQLRLPR